VPVDPEFWHQRWSAGNTPWQQPAPNARLSAHFDALALAPDAEVLVPMCGRALDMRWLLEHRFRVLGVELSPIAVHAFFEDHGLRFTERDAGGFRLYDGDRIRILCGDVLAVTRAHLAGVSAVYDRAALIALDEADQARYATLLAHCLPTGARQLLLTLEYDTVRMDGPPFSVGESRVRALYDRRFAVERVASVDVIDDEPHLRARGLDALTEHAFVLGDRSV